MELKMAVTVEESGDTHIHESSMSLPRSTAPPGIQGGNRLVKCPYTRSATRRAQPVADDIRF